MACRVSCMDIWENHDRVLFCGTAHFHKESCIIAVARLFLCAVFLHEAGSRRHTLAMYQSLVAAPQGSSLIAACNGPGMVC